MAGKSQDPNASQIIQEAILCKLWHCTPSQLRKEKFEDVMNHSLVYNEMARKNPMALFM